jgi:hypothetical protein
MADIISKAGGIMPKSKLETAKTLAKAHFGVEPNLTRICLIEPFNEQDPDDPIKLLEVVEGTIERGIEPVGFTADPAHGIGYPSIVVEISPTEDKAIRERGGRIGFEDWTVGRELLTR